MWRDRALQKMKELGYTKHDVATHSKGKLTEKKVIRLLSGETKLPCIDDVDGIAIALGMTLSELVADSDLVIGDTKANEALQIELELLKADRDRLISEVTQLSDRLATVTAEKTIADHDNECMKELIRTKNKMISLLESTVAKDEPLHYPPQALTFH